LTYKNEGNAKLLDLILKPAGRILDCGCGAGDNARILSNRGWRVTAITIDPQERDAARDFCEAVHLADLEKGIPTEIEGKFDAVLASHVLEHLARPERLLQDVRQRLRPTGLLAVALPNIAHYHQRISLLRGRFNYADTGQLDRTHLRFYTYTTAIQLLRQNGFDPLIAAADGSVPLWKARRLVSPTIEVRLNKWAVGQWPNLLGSQALLIASARTGQQATHDHVADAR
jgi:SAM-dependent methyltransferase